MSANAQRTPLARGLRAAATVVLTVAITGSAFGVTTTSDRNADGVTDSWVVSDGTELVEIIADRDYDGQIDYRADFTEGRLQYEEYDFNADGLMDDFYYYSAGVLLRHELDTDYDGAIDTWVYVEQGVYVSWIARDTDGDGAADRAVDYTQTTP